MLELNKVLLIGNLTRDPELSYIQSGQALAKLGLAVNRRFKDRTGEWKDETAFVDLEVWGKTAEFCSQYLKKGRRVFVEGRLKFDRWEMNDGTRRTKLSVVADRVQFADAKPSEDRTGSAEPESGGEYSPPSPPSSKPAQTGARTAAASSQPFPEPPMEEDSTADDLPF